MMSQRFIKLRLQRACSIVGMLLMLALALPATADITDASSPEPLRFALIGDIPYNEREIRQLPGLFADMVERRSRYVIHVGDLKAAAESCQDRLLEARHRLLDSSPLALVYTPGDNEWVDCERDRAGNYDARERLARLRELFFANSQSAGLQPLALQRQSNTRRFRAYPENSRWETADVLFLTLNLPGSNNNFRADGGRNAEFEDRLQANRYWLNHAFLYAQQKDFSVIVIAFHANPFTSQKIHGRDGYAEFKTQLRSLAQKFKGEILLLHGDTHHYRIDHPLLDEDGEPLKNVTRVESFGSPFNHAWVEVEIDTSRLNERPVLRITPQRLGPSPAPQVMGDIDAND